MNDPQDRTARPGAEPDAGPHEPVGSVAEEAAKLFGALSSWARDQEPDGPGAGGAGAAAGAHDALRRGLHDVGEHLGGAGTDAGGADCRFCPVCQVIHVVRQTSPEVRAHLASAAGSLMQAAAGFLATAPPSERGPVEHIDLDGDPEDEPGDERGRGMRGESER